VILLVDGRQYAAVILGEVAGKVEAGRREKGDDEKSAKSGRDKNDDEKEAKARGKEDKGGDDDDAKSNDGRQDKKDKGHDNDDD